MIKIGINGFGRIGRLAFRAAICADDIEVVAVNAPDKTPEQLAYTVKYDSVHGRFNGTVDFEEGENPALIVNGKRVALLNNRDAKLLPWGELGVEYVLECTGAFLTKEKAQDHLDAGAQVVVLSGPSKDDTPMFVCGVNLDAYTPDIKIVSNASCTTNCLAPLAKIINDNFGIVEGLMTTPILPPSRSLTASPRRTGACPAACTATSSRPAPALPRLSARLSRLCRAS
jgi:glyceraldehyde 3-phosphate dehydrogenase